VPWLKQLIVGQSLHRSMFDSRPVHVGYVVDEVAMGKAIHKCCGFPLPVSFHQCSVLFVYY